MPGLWHRVAWLVGRLLVVASLITLLSGCGDSSESSKDALARRANAICARYQPVYRQGVRTQTTRAAIVAYLDRTMPAADRQVGELRALRPAESEAVRVRRLLAHLRAGRRTFVELRAAVVARADARALEIGRRLGAQNRQMKRELLALGWNVCAEDPRNLRSK